MDFVDNECRQDVPEEFRIGWNTNSCSPVFCHSRRGRRHTGQSSLSGSASLAHQSRVGSAVYSDIGTVNEGRTRRGEKQDQIRDFLRFTNSTQAGSFCGGSLRGCRLPD